MLLRHSLKLETEAAELEACVYQAFESGVRTADMAPAAGAAASTAEAGACVLSNLQRRG